MKKKNKRKKSQSKERHQRQNSKNKNAANGSGTVAVGVNRQYTKEELADLADWRDRGVTNPLTAKNTNPARERAKKLEQAAYLARHQQALSNQQPGSFGAMLARRKQRIMQKAVQVRRKVDAHEVRERAKIAAMISKVGLDPATIMRK